MIVWKLQQNVQKLTNLHIPAKMTIFYMVEKLVINISKMFSIFDVAFILWNQIKE